MKFLPTDEQIAIAQSVREALAKHSSPDVLRESDKAAQRRRIWPVLVELGMFALTVSEAAGGLGLDQRYALGVLEETGRAATPGPIAESFAVVQLLNALPHCERAAELLARIADGRAMATLGLGAQPLIESADEADVIVVERGGGLHVLDCNETQLRPQPSIDSNRHLFTVEWEASPATLLVSGEQAVAALEAARLHVLFAVSSQLVGLGKALLDLTVTHVRLREQFGRPLGALQAVQHRLADVAVKLEFAEPVVARAACSLAQGLPSSSRDVAMAKIFASEAGETAAYSGLWLHGAIGYTREHDFHLYALRAWSLALAYGDAHRHRIQVAENLFGKHPAARFPAY